MDFYNRLSNTESLELLERSREDRVTLSFYKYFKIENLIILEIIYFHPGQK